MLAYHSDPRIKMRVLSQLLHHAQADEIIKGIYWENGKGCAVGCTIHSGDHAEYEPLFGIPQALARLKDCMFEGLPNADAKRWPRRFMSAVRPGADLSRVQWHFLHWLLTDKEVNPWIDHPLVCDAVRRCADLMRDMADGKTITYSAADSAAASADSAADSARSAADSAYSARSAAYLAADSAAYSAYLAADLAHLAADSAKPEALAARCAVTNGSRLESSSIRRMGPSFSVRSASDVHHATSFKQIANTRSTGHAHSKLSVISVTGSQRLILSRMAA
jgi:hypothetical protein